MIKYSKRNSKTEFNTNEKTSKQVKNWWKRIKRISRIAKRRNLRGHREEIEDKVRVYIGYLIQRSIRAKRNFKAISKHKRILSINYIKKQEKRRTEKKGQNQKPSESNWRNTDDKRGKKGDSSKENFKDFSNKISTFQQKKFFLFITFFVNLLTLKKKVINEKNRNCLKLKKSVNILK